MGVVAIGYRGCESDRLLSGLSGSGWLLLGVSGGLSIRVKLNNAS